AVRGPDPARGPPVPRCRLAMWPGRVHLPERSRRGVRPTVLRGGRRDDYGSLPLLVPDPSHLRVPPRPDAPDRRRAVPGRGSEGINTPARLSCEPKGRADSDGT